MNFPYVLFLLTFLGYPIVAGILISYFGDAVYTNGNSRIRSYAAVCIPFFLLYDAAYYLGYSFSGDNADYIILSLQYLVICIFSVSINSSGKIGVEIVRMVGYIVLGVGSLFGIFGIVSALPVTNGPFDKEFVLKSHKHSYVLRRYSDFELAPSAIFYTFSLYRQFGGLPIEKIVCESKGSDEAVDQPLDPKICIIDSSNNKQYLLIKPETDTATIREIE